MLTEVIVALVILALGLGALFGSVSVGTQAAATANQQRAATMAARSLLAELGHSRPLQDGTSEGALSGDLHWRLRIAPSSAGNTGPRPVLEGHTVALTITWPQNAQTRRLDFHTLFVKPAP